MQCFKPREDGDDVIRPLNHFERFFSSMHLKNLHLGVVISCRYIVPSSFDRSSIKDTVKRAIARSVLEHPVLCVGQAGEDTESPTWVQLDALDLNVHIDWRSIDGDSPEAHEKAFEDAVRPHVDLHLPDLETRPGWRIIVFEPQGGQHNWIEVLFGFSHLTGDGPAGKIFHHTLLRNLRDPSTEDSEVDKKLSPDGKTLRLPKFTKQTFTPSTEDLIHFSYSPGYALGTLWKELRPAGIGKARGLDWVPHWAGPTTATRWKLFWIDAAKAVQLLKICREHQTTLSGLLQAVTLVVFSTSVPEDKATRFVCETYINLRRFMKSTTIDPENTILASTTGLPHEFDDKLVAKIRKQMSEGADKNNQTVFEVAADVRSQLVRKLEMGNRNIDIGLLKFASDMRKFCEDEMKKPRRTTWALSNMGVISNDLPGQNPGTSDEDVWRIDQCVFAQSSYKSGEVFDVSVAGVKGGPISVCCIWEHGVLPDDLGATLTEKIEEQLLILCDGVSA
ncbi:hypothetical protein GQ53DRAFT_675144 [Thozetella sp. PMI_491]|nr:hypothetical protein GQ53DRAFT_675144 [Thozetella sp. PMI_491]